MTPRQQALAYRIWAYAEPLGWNCTAGEIAEALGVTYQTVSGVLKMKGWNGRTRSTQQDSPEYSAHHGGAAIGPMASMEMAGIPARPEISD